MLRSQKKLLVVRNERAWNTKSYIADTQSESTSDWFSRHSHTLTHHTLNRSRGAKNKPSYRTNLKSSRPFSNRNHRRGPTGQHFLLHLRHSQPTMRTTIIAALVAGACAFGKFVHLKRLRWPPVECLLLFDNTLLI